MWYHYHRFERNIVRKLGYISDVSKDIAQIFFGILAVESFTKATIDWRSVFLGILLSLIFWSFGIISYKNK